MASAGGSDDQGGDDRRRPNNMQGLLNFSIENTQSEDAPSEGSAAQNFSSMDPEKPLDEAGAAAGDAITTETELNTPVKDKPPPPATVETVPTEADLKRMITNQDKALKSLGLHRLKIPPDGNSLFRAIAWNMRMEQHKYHQILRKATVNWMTEYSKDLLDAGLLKCGDDVEEVKRVNGKSNQACIVAIANMIMANIVVISGGDSGELDIQHVSPFDGPADSEQGSIMLAFIPENHYDAIVDEPDLPNHEYDYWLAKRQKFDFDALFSGKNRKKKDTEETTASGDATDSSDPAVCGKAEVEEPEKKEQYIILYGSHPSILPERQMSTLFEDEEPPSPAVSSEPSTPMYEDLPTPPICIDDALVADMDVDLPSPPAMSFEAKPMDEEPSELETVSPEPVPMEPSSPEPVPMEPASPEPIVEEPEPIAEEPVEPTPMESSSEETTIVIPAVQEPVPVEQKSPEPYPMERSSPEVVPEESSPPVEPTPMEETMQEKSPKEPSPAKESVSQVPKLVEESVSEEKVPESLPTEPSADKETVVEETSSVVKPTSLVDMKTEVMEDIILEKGRSSPTPSMVPEPPTPLEERNMEFAENLTDFEKEELVEKKIAAEPHLKKEVQPEVSILEKAVPDSEKAVEYTDQQKKAAAANISAALGSVSKPKLIEVKKVDGTVTPTIAKMKAVEIEMKQAPPPVQAKVDVFKPIEIKMQEPSSPVPAQVEPKKRLHIEMKVSMSPHEAPRITVERHGESPSRHPDSPTKVYSDAKMPSTPLERTRANPDSSKNEILSKEDIKRILAEHGISTPPTRKTADFGTDARTVKQEVPVMMASEPDQDTHAPMFVRPVISARLGLAQRRDKRPPRIEIPIRTHIIRQVVADEDSAKPKSSRVIPIEVVRRGSGDTPRETTRTPSSSNVQYRDVQETPVSAREETRAEPKPTPSTPGKGVVRNIPITVVRQTSKEYNEERNREPQRSLSREMADESSGEREELKRSVSRESNDEEFNAGRENVRRTTSREDVSDPQKGRSISITVVHEKSAPNTPRSASVHEITVPRSSTPGTPRNITVTRSVPSTPRDSAPSTPRTATMTTTRRILPDGWVEVTTSTPGAEEHMRSMPFEVQFEERRRVDSPRAEQERGTERRRVGDWTVEDRFDSPLRPLRMGGGLNLRSLLRPIKQFDFDQLDNFFNDKWWM